MTNTLEAGAVLMGLDAVAALPVWDGDNRARGITGTMATPAPIANVAKILNGRTAAELGAREAAELATAVDTVRGAFLVSPSGTSVYVMRETSRTIKGAKWRGLSLVRVIPVGDVIALRVS